MLPVCVSGSQTLDVDDSGRSFYVFWHKNSDMSGIGCVLDLVRSTHPLGSEYLCCVSICVGSRR